MAFSLAFSPVFPLGVRKVEAASTVPKLLNYQARITDDAGVPVPDGNLNIWIKVYDAPTGGNCLYAMRGSCGTPSYKTVTVSSGVFSMLIGDTAGGDNAISDTLFDTDALYLGVTVASDTEMVPRKRITAAPYAMNADRLDDMDVTSSGSDTASIVALTSNGNLVVTGDPQGSGISNGSLYVNPASAAASETLFGIASAGSSRWSIDKEGDVAHTGSLLATAASSTAQFVFQGAASQSNNIFEVQDSLSNRILQVSATATRVTDLIVSGTCTGCGATTLNAAYLSATGSPEIAISPSIGALTIADTIGGRENIFEITNRVNSAGAYNSRLFTVSSTSTLIGVESDGTALSGSKVGVGTGTPAARLHVNNNGESILNLTNELASVTPSWVMSIGNAVQHADGMFIIGPGTGAGLTADKALSLQAGGGVLIGNSTAAILQSVASTLQLRANSTTATNLFQITTNNLGNLASTGGVQNVLNIGQTFAPTSGSAEFRTLLLAPTVNQTGTAVGDYSIFKIAPTITASTGTFKYLIEAGTAASESLFVLTEAGRVGIGNAAPSHLLTVGSGTSTFEVNATGNLVKVNGVPYSWPSAQGGSSTVLTNDGSGNLTWSAASASTLNQAYLSSTSSNEIYITPSLGALTIADTFSGTGNIFEIQDRTNAAGDYSRRYFTVSSTSTRIDGPGTYDLTINAVNDTGISISRSNTLEWRLRNDFATPAGVNDVFVLSEGIVTPRFSIRPTVGWAGINTDDAQAPLEVRPTSDTVIQNVFSVTNASNSARYLTVSSTAVESMPDTDFAATFGRFTLRNHSTDIVHLGHYDWNSSTTVFGLRFDQDGDVYLRANGASPDLNFQSGTSGSSRITWMLNGTQRMQMDSSGRLNVGGSAISPYVALSVRDPLASPTSNIFEVANSLSTAPYLTVSSTSTQLNYPNVTSQTALLLNAGNLTTGNGLLIDAATATAFTTGSALSIVGPSSNTTSNSNGVALDVRMNGDVGNTNNAAMVRFTGTGTTSGNVATITAGDSFSTGNVLHLNSRSTLMTTGSLLHVNKSSTSGGSSAYTGSVAQVTYDQIFSGGANINNTGSAFSVARNYTVNGAAAWPRVTGPVADFSDTLTLTDGWVNHGANVVRVSQKFAGATNTALNVTSSATGGGAAYIAARYEPLVVASSQATPTSSIFTVQNSVTAEGKYSQRYLTVSATSMNFSCVGCGATDRAMTVTADSTAVFRIASSGSNPSSLQLHRNESGNNWQFLVDTVTAEALQFRVNSTERLRMTTNGLLTSTIGGAGNAHAFTLGTAWTNGTIVNAGFTGATTLSSTAIGANINFHDFVTPAAGGNVTGFQVFTPSFTQSSATTTNLIGLVVNGQGGGLTQNTAAGTLTWRGADIILPNTLVETTGTVDAKGVYVRNVLSSGGGDRTGLDVSFVAAGGGSLTGVNLSLASNAGANERALVISANWDADIEFLDTSPLIQLANTGTITFRDSAANTLMTLADDGSTGDMTITGDLTVNGTCTGCGGSSTTLGGAYGASTGTAEIYLDSTRGALTIADSFSSFGGNLFEIQDRTNAAGAYSTRYFVVSATSTNATYGNNALAIDRNLVMTGSDGSFPSVSGAGTRMMWVPTYGSFRAGRVTGSEWDSGNTGNYSAAFGEDNIASGSHASAFGYNNTVSGNYGFSAGRNNTVIASDGVAFGDSNTASTDAFVTGFSNSATGTQSAAFGNESAAVGLNAFAGGYRAVAAGSDDFAFGANVSVRGGLSAALGYYLYSDQVGTFTIGHGAGDGASRLYNDVTKSFMVGFDSTTPTLTVRGKRTTGSPNLLKVTGQAHTTLTASTEASDVVFDLNRSVQFSTGALTTQRAFVVQAPTYGFVGSSTITNAATFAISGAPAAGTNATITNAYALWVQGGAARFDGAARFGSASSTDSVDMSSVRIASNLTPTTDNLYSLGDYNRRWKDLWLSGGSANIAYDTSGTSILQLGWSDAEGRRARIYSSSQDLQITTTSARSGGINIAASGNVGINDATPEAKLSVNDGAVLFTGSVFSGVGTTPTSGAGTRFMWIPDKAALRAGEADSTSWNDSNIGYYSTAFGDRPKASGEISFAVGLIAEATAHSSVAIGATTSATSTNAIAIGNNAQAGTGGSAISIGLNSKSVAAAAISIGDSTVASGLNAIAIGRSVKATASDAIVIGQSITNSISGSLGIGFTGTDPQFIFRSTGWLGIGTVTPGTTSRLGIEDNNASAIGISAANTAITTGTLMKLTGGSAMTTGGVLDITGSYTHTGAADGHTAKLTVTNASNNSSGASNVRGLTVSGSISNSSGGGSHFLRMVDLDYTSHTCGAGTCSFSGLRLGTPAFTSSNATTNTLSAINLNNAGAIVQDTAAGSITWSGISLAMPDITQSTGTVEANGIVIFGNTVSGGTSNGIKLNSNANIRFTGNTGTIIFPDVASTTNGMIKMMNGSGNANGMRRCVLCHSETFSDWGLAYNDSDDQFYIQTGNSATPAVEFPVTGGGSTNIVIDANGVIETNLHGTNTVNGVCHSGTDVDSGSALDRLLNPCSSTANDIAEWFPVADSATATEIVVATTQTLTYQADNVDAWTGTIDGKETLVVAYVEKSSGSYQGNIVGIVSSSPVQNYGRGVLETTDQAVPVAVTGRVPTRVNLEGGSIRPGDPITTSSTPGVGMKATKPGIIVGFALDSWNGPGEGTVLVMLQVGFHSGLAITTDGVTSLLGDDFALVPRATATASNTQETSFSLSFRGSAWNGASNTAVTRNIKVLNEVSDTANYQLAFRNDNNNLLASLNQAGDLSIAGTLSVEGGFDYAEMFPSVPDIEAGDIVMVDPDNANGYGVKKTQTAYENSAIGVISTRPGFLTGKSEEGSQPVALAGRVPVKVNMEGGNINPGDPITSSSTPGVGMKATEAGRVIGIALQGASSNGTVLIFVNPSWWNGPMPVGGATASSGLTIAQDALLDFKNSVLSNVAAIISTNGSWGVTSDGHLVAQKLEAKDVAAETFTVKASAETPERTVGVGRIKAGYDAVLVPNAKVKPDSLIVVTFEGNPGANWWIDEKFDGHFVLKLAQGAHMDLKFTYWIVPIEGALEPETDEDGSATGTEETPPPDEETGSGTGTPETGGDTGSGSGTEETP